MTEKTAWQRFFDEHAPIYDDNVFVKNTINEVDFLLGELALPSGGSILDVGCGTGRHSIELAKRGYAVTGIDLSTEMLARARAAAEAAGVTVEWINADATRFSLPKKFDAVICLCAGAFGLLELVGDPAGDPASDPIDQPLAILSNISRSLKPEAKAMLTVLNGMAMIRRFADKDVESGQFDPLALVDSSAHSPREGLAPVMVRQRAFVPTELAMLLRLAGMSAVNMWGGTAGNWGKRPLNLDEMEIMVVARKTGEPLAGA